MKTFHFLTVLFHIGLILSFFSCSADDTSSIDNEKDFSALIDKYALHPVDQADYNKYKNLEPVTSPEQLEEILSHFSIAKKEIIETRSPMIPRIKTRGEIQKSAVISGSNSNGRASVHVDLLGPSVITSTYHLGIMDAFVDYTHLSGSAFKNRDVIEFSANGEGIVKLIWQGITLQKFNASIEGYCDSNGKGALTKF